MSQTSLQEKPTAPIGENHRADAEGAPVLSIVIVSWNTRDILRDCLTSLFEYTKALAFEIIVVDNASADGSPKMLEQEFPQVKVIRNNSNVGFARACNQGMRISAGDLILLLNSDTYVRDDVIARMTDYVLERPEVAMAGCQLRYPDGRIQRSASRSLSIWRSLFEDLWLYKLVTPAMRDDILLGEFWHSDEEKEVDWLAGAFMMLRREVFERVGGFAEDFFMYGEDGEWCMRIKRAGGRVFYTPLGVVYHLGSVSSDIEWTQKERLRLCHFGGLRAYAKVNGRPLGFYYHLARLFGSVVRYSVYSLLAAIRPGEFYRNQKTLYGWQIEFYLEAYRSQAKTYYSMPVAEK